MERKDPDPSREIASDTPTVSRRGILGGAAFLSLHALFGTAVLGALEGTAEAQDPRTIFPYIAKNDRELAYLPRSARESIQRPLEDGERMRFRPYTIKLPSASKEAIYEAFLNTPGEIKGDAIDYAKLFQRRWPRLFEGGKSIPISLDLEAFADTLASFVKKWEKIRASEDKGWFVLKGGENRAMDYSPFFTPEDPLIQKLAREITAGLEEPEDQLQALLMFVQSFPYIKDPSLSIDRPAFPQAFLLARGGDCEDMSNTFVSLALSLPSLKNSGIEILYAVNPLTKGLHVLLGARGRSEKYKIGDHPFLAEVDGLFVADPTLLGTFFGYPPFRISQKDILYRFPVS